MTTERRIREGSGADHGWIKGDLRTDQRGMRHGLVMDQGRIRDDLGTVESWIRVRSGTD